MTAANYTQTECVICHEAIEVDTQQYDVQDGDYAHISCLNTIGLTTFAEDYNDLP